MAIYEYRCDDCGKKFTVTERISEHGDEKRAHPCPKCKSEKTTQLYTPFYAKTSAKS